jgi:lipase chaperone LimK
VHSSEARETLENASSLELHYAGLNDDALATQVASLRTRVAALQQSFEVLASKRNDLLRRGEKHEADGQLTALESLAEARLSMVSRLTAAAFEQTCRSLPSCNTQPRGARSPVEE